MTHYIVNVRQVRELTFHFSDDDIAPGDTLQDAANEIACTLYNSPLWDVEDEDVEVKIDLTPDDEA